MKQNALLTSELKILDPWIVTHATSFRHQAEVTTSSSKETYVDLCDAEFYHNVRTTLPLSKMNEVKTQLNSANICGPCETGKLTIYREVKMRDHIPKTRKNATFLWIYSNDLRALFVYCTCTWSRTDSIFSVFSIAVCNWRSARQESWWHYWWYNLLQ